MGKAEEKAVNGKISERVENGKRLITERHEVMWRKGQEKPILLGAIEIELPAEMADYCEVGDSKYSALAALGWKTWRNRQITNAQDSAREKWGAEKGLVIAKPINIARQLLAKAQELGINPEGMDADALLEAMLAKVRK